MWCLDDYKNTSQKSSIVKMSHADSFHDVPFVFPFKNRSISGYPPWKCPLPWENELDDLDEEKKVTLLHSDEHDGSECKTS